MCIDDYIIVMIRGGIVSGYRKRKQWSTATDIELHRQFKKLADETRIASTRLLDEAIEDLLVKYGRIKKEDKKTP